MTHNMMLSKPNSTETIVTIPTDCIQFTSESGSEIELEWSEVGHNATYYISVNDGAWTATNYFIASGTSIKIGGQGVMDSAMFGIPTTWSLTCSTNDVIISGYIDALVDYNNVMTGEEKYNSGYGIYLDSLFSGCTAIKKVFLKIDTTCYESFEYMFEDCTNLVEVSLDFSTCDAGWFEESCCAGMFSDCTSLTKATVTLPSNPTVQNYAFSNMFSGCTSLTDVPDLPE